MNLDSIFADDRGVSPVIGVILMVAITVILAAVIGSFVLGLGDSLNEGVTAGVSVDQNDTTVTVTLVDNGTADTVRLRQGNSDVADSEMNSVGDTATAPVSGGTVQVVASTSDGTEAVIRTIEV